MANTYLTPNMNLIIPVPGQDPGPDWANNLISSLTIVDAHTHLNGTGVPITPAAININSPLLMNGFTLSATGSVLFATQTTTPANLNLYVDSPDLFFVDGNGNNVQMTLGGAVNATSSGISSGSATAAFVGGALVVDSTTNTPGNVQCGSVLIGNNVASSNFITLSAPNSLASSYPLVLPAIPSQTNVMTVDTSGNMGSVTYDTVGSSMTSVGANAIGVSMTATGANAIGASINSASSANQIGQSMTASGANSIANNITSIISSAANVIANARTRSVSSNPGLGGVAFATLSGTVSTTSMTFQTVTAMTITITTSGRPIVLFVAPISTLGGLGASQSGGNTCLANFRIVNSTASSALASFQLETGISAAGNSVITAPGFSTLDIQAAGAYTYTFQYASGVSGGTASVINMLIFGYEL